MAHEEGMEEYEFINKDDLDESLPPKTAEMASSAASATSVFQDRNTHALSQLRTEEYDDSDDETEISSPVARGTPRSREAEVGLLIFRHPVPPQVRPWVQNHYRYELSNVAQTIHAAFCTEVLSHMQY